MNNFFLLTSTLLATVSFGFIANGATTSEPVPTATVTVAHDEVEIEYLPPVTVTVVDAEVEIEFIPEG